MTEPNRECLDDLIDELNRLCERHGCEPGSNRMEWLDARLAAARPDAGAVKVKSLHWVRSNVFGSRKWRGICTVFGREVICFMEGDLSDEQIREKQAAAQADYDQRILSIIELPAKAAGGVRESPWFQLHDDGVVYRKEATGINTAKYVVVCRDCSLEDARFIVDAKANALARDDGAAGNDCACGKFSDGLTCPGPDGVPLCVQPSAAGETQSSDVEALTATSAKRPGTIASEPEPSTSDPLNWRLSEETKRHLAEIDAATVRPGDPRLNQIICGPSESSAPSKRDEPVAWRMPISGINGHFTYSNGGGEGWEPLFAHHRTVDAEAIKVANRVRDLIADLQGEHEATTGPFDASKWKIEVPVTDLQILATAIAQLVAGER